jgi:N-acetyl-anhydromuramyl-L-alanine amidase AmpD
MPETIEELKQKRADLRDAQDKLHEVHVPAGTARKMLHDLRIEVRERIDRITVRIQKRRARPNRIEPKVVLTRFSPNRSGRTSDITSIVIHSTESDNVESSSSDLAGVANWFANPSAQVSAHVIVDADGESARCVADADKAWHCVAFNSATLGVENIGHAAQSTWAEAEVKEAARWCARWHKLHGIPLERGVVSGSAITKPGILTHEQLGTAGGGHHDPGSSYPIGRLIEFAKELV